MRSDERVAICQRRMVEGCSLPGIDAVAVDAGSGESGASVFLIVVGTVAGQAIGVSRGIKLRFESGRWGVTRRTGQDLMCPDEIESVGEVRMIEGGSPPGFDTVTGGAISRISRPGVVLIKLCLVTRGAVILVGCREERGERTFDMAGDALERLMTTQQIESRRCYDVLESGPVFPGERVVARLTGLRIGHGSVGRLIIRFVTGSALRFGYYECPELIAPMAAFAG